MSLRTHANAQVINTETGISGAGWGDVNECSEESKLLAVNIALGFARAQAGCLYNSACSILYVNWHCYDPLLRSELENDILDCIEKSPFIESLPDEGWLSSS